MNATRDPDRRIQAWLDLMPDEAPDRVIAAVQQAVEDTPQVRRGLVPASWRLNPMNRLILVAAAIVVVVGASLYVLRPSSKVGAPKTTASPTASAFPTALRSGWIADVGQIPALGNTDPRALLRVTRDGTTLDVTFPADHTTSQLASQPVAGAADELDLAAIGSGSGCAAGDAGRYHATISSDGLFLTLAAVSDACASRGTVLARTWARSLDGPSAGGRGVVAAFDPSFWITLPAATYTAEIGPDAAALTSATPDRTLFAVKNPAGYADPCSNSGGAKIQVPHTIAAFSAYLDSLPGLTVQSESIQIDGRAAAHLTIPVATPASCASGVVNEWTQGDVAASGGWHINNGDTDVVYLVEVGSDLYLLQWLGSGVLPAEELAVLSTVHFVNGIPTGS
jgi:hypothetical protein